MASGNQLIENNFPYVKDNKGIVTKYPVTLSGSSANLAVGGNLTITGTQTFTGATGFGGAVTITSTSASALTVGRQGATNPVLKINANTSSVVTGISVTGAASGGGVAVAAISSATDEALTIDAKGAGTIGIGSVSTGAVTITPATTITGNLTVGSSKLVVTASSGTTTLAEGANIAVGTTTGTKIGTAASQKIGFFNATPVVQQTKAGHNNWAALSDVVSALVSLGLFDTA